MNNPPNSKDGFDIYSLLERLPLATNVVDGSGRYVYVSQKFCDLVGYTRDELMEMSFWDITPVTSQNRDHIAFESLENFGSTGWFSKVFRHKDGLLMPAAVIVSTLEISKKTFYIALIDRNLSY